MRIAVIGSRTFNDFRLLKDTLDSVYISGIILGGDLGANKLAEQYANEKNIPIEIIPHAEGSELTYSIVSRAQLVVAFWDGKSQGTQDLLKYAKRQGKQISIKYFRE